MVTLRCEDRLEAVVFNKYGYGTDRDYEINVEDCFQGYNTRGFIARIKRAWAAFTAKPMIYTGIFCKDSEKMRKFLTDCLALVDEEVQDVE